MPKTLYPANEPTDMTPLQRLRNRFLGGQPYNPINGPPTTQKILEELIKGAPLDTQRMARDMVTGVSSSPKPQDYMRTNDPNGAPINQVDMNYRLAQRQQAEQAAQRQAVLNQLNVVLPSPPPEQGANQGMKINPLDALKIDPTKLLE